MILIYPTRGVYCICGKCSMIRRTRYDVRDTTYAIRRTRYDVRDTTYGIRRTGYDARDTCVLEPI